MADTDDQVLNEVKEVIDVTPSKPKLLDEFAKTSAAAKMSGAFHETAGKIKQKLGEFRDDEELSQKGRDQQLLGKVHRFVGTIRGFKTEARNRYQETTQETIAICRKHGSRLLDVASDFVEDMKKALLK